MNRYAIRMTRLIQILSSVLVSAFVISPNCWGQPDIEAKDFAIVRDSTLGKPLVLLRKPPRDKQGRNAADLLEVFLKHVRDGKFKEAKNLCFFSVSGLRGPDSIGVSTKDDLPKDPKYAQATLARLEASEGLFPQWTRRLQQTQQFTIGAIVKQKGNFWSVQLKAEGMQPGLWRSDVYFSFEDNEWRIRVCDLASRIQPVEQEEADRHPTAK